MYMPVTPKSPYGSGLLFPGGGGLGNFDRRSEKNFNPPSRGPQKSSTPPLAGREKCNPPPSANPACIVVTNLVP